MTVGELIRELTKYPMDAPCYAYEGEGVGVVIVTNTKPAELATSMIETPQDWDAFETMDTIAAKHKELGSMEEADKAGGSDDMLLSE